MCVNYLYIQLTNSFFSNSCNFSIRHFVKVLTNLKIMTNPLHLIQSNLKVQVPSQKLSGMVMITAVILGNIAVSLLFLAVYVIL